MLNKRYFSSIEDIPLKNFWNAQDGFYEHCRIDLNVGSEEEDLEAWIKINDSYLSEFGIGPEFEKIIELKKEIAILQCEYIENDDNYLRNQIKRLKIELDDILKRPVTIDRDGVLIHIEKWRGIEIDENRMTAKKFYKIVREYENYIERSLK